MRNAQTRKGLQKLMRRRACSHECQATPGFDPRATFGIDPLGLSQLLRLLRRGPLRHKSRAVLLVQSIDIASDRDDVVVVQQPIENRRCRDGVAEYGSPLAPGAIAG